MEQTGNYYQRGLALAEEGNFNEALCYLQEHLRSNPADAEVLNDIGAVLHCLGRDDEAIGYLLRAKGLQGENPHIIWNLVEAYLAAGRLDEASKHFYDMQRIGIFNPDVVNRTAKAYLDKGNKSGAIEVLLLSLKCWPVQQKIFGPMIEVIRSTRPKISFFCGLEGDKKFLTDIIEYTRLLYPAQFYEVKDIGELRQAMEDSDICWFEWCTDLAVEASRLPNACKTIVRLHRFEAYGDWPSRVRWENIDYLILVGNSFVKQALLKQVPDIEARTKVVVIPNGVNLDKFKFVNRQKGKNLACIGYLNMRKNPMFLMQCMQKLHYMDPEYRLYFAGNFQDYGLEQYLRHIVKAMGLEGVVFFDNWLDDVEGWLADKHFVVSASISESEGMGILEAMACGLKPVIHNFPGAEEIFGSEFLFNISEDFCRQILSENYEPYRYRSFVEKRYPLNRQLAGIDRIFGQLEAETGAHRGSGIKPAEAAGGNEGASSFKKGFGEEINKVAATTARRGF